MTTTHKYLLLASLYLAQGLPFGFFTQAVPVLMRQQRYSLEWIGFASLLALPWALKWLWAPWVDRYYWPHLGRRRSWILPIQCLTVLVIVMLAFADNGGGLSILLIGCFFTNLLSSTQDIATDGLAVQMLSLSERGMGNGIQVAGYRLGMVAGGGALLIAFDILGWTSALLMMAALMALTSLPVLAFDEKRRAPAVGPDSRNDTAPRVAPNSASANQLIAYLRRPGMTGWLLLVLLYKGGDALASAMFRPFLVDSGYSMSQIGWLSGSVGSLAGLTGALTGGLLLNRCGRRLALGLFGTLSASCIAGFGWAALGKASFFTLGLLSATEHFTGGLATTALFTCMMDQCRPGHEGSDYTLQASAVVVTSGLAHGFSGVLAASLGYSWHFFVAACLALLGAVLITHFYPQLSRQRLNGSAGRRNKRGELLSPQLASESTQ